MSRMSILSRALSRRINNVAIVCCVRAIWIGASRAGCWISGLVSHGRSAARSRVSREYSPTTTRDIGSKALLDKEAERSKEPLRRMLCENLHMLPLCLFVLIPVTFVITYTISVQWDHVAPGFPYISETGTLSPESCIFAQCLNIAAFLLGCCVYIRHRQVDQWRKERGEGLVHRRTVAVTAWCGALACFGLDILANFQEARVVAAHTIGAMTCFTAGTIYFCLQTYLSYKMESAVNGRAVIFVRAALSALTFLLTTATIIPGYISMSEFRGSDYKKWLPRDGGWGWHVASALSEWILAIVYCLFLLTFVPEFRLINFEPPIVTLIYPDEARNDKTSDKPDETGSQQI